MVPEGRCPPPPRSSMSLLTQFNKNLISSIPYLSSRFGHRIFERLATLLHERIRSSPIYTCSCSPRSSSSSSSSSQCDSAENGRNEGAAKPDVPTNNCTLTLFGFPVSVTTIFLAGVSFAVLSLSLSLLYDTYFSASHCPCFRRT